MPIYNAYDYLGPALDSVLDQTLKEIEIICIDDGSTDHSLEIIKEYQKRDARVRIVTENNAGVSTARNKGLVRARGDYIMFLDADDFYHPELVERAYNRAVKDGLDITLVRFDLFNNKSLKFFPSIDEDHGDIYKDGAVASKNEYPNYIFSSASGYVWNKLFSAKFLKEKELTFAPELYVFEDVYFVCCALSLAERVGRIDEVLVHHRIYSDQSRAKLFKKYYTHVPAVHLKIKEFLRQHGMYIPLMSSFINHSASRCYKIYNLLWSDAKEKFWDLLHSGYADSLGWFGQEAAEFESLDVRDFVANVGLYTYKQHEKLLKKGREFSFENLSLTSLKKKIKKFRKNAKIRARLANLGRKLAKPFRKKK
jgi:glycosyltransferase involved in cell wall biosynthesis